MTIGVHLRSSATHTPNPTSATFAKKQYQTNPIFPPSPTTQTTSAVEKRTQNRTQSDRFGPARRRRAFLSDLGDLCVKIPLGYNSCLATVPLCVDLDGTLIRTDMTVECAVLALKRRPWLAPLLLLWLFQGKSVLKRRLAERVEFDPATLPYNHEFLAFLHYQHAAGRRLILATASDRLVAERIAGHLHFFDKIIASEPGDNVKGPAKLAALQRLFPEGFDYAGDSPADQSILAAARRAILVDPAPLLRHAVASPERVFETPARPLLSSLFSALRVHQWSKNILVFVPIVTSHRITNPADFTAGALTFVAFCFASAGVYVINDIVDLDSDRRHPGKRNRVFASGALPIAAAFLLAPLLFAASAGVLWFLPGETRFVLGIYCLVSLLYSLYFKSKLLLDVFSLSGLFTLRIVAGHASTGIVLTDWLISFAIFLFLSLAFLKRSSELRNLRNAGGDISHGRAYSSADLEPVTMFGIGAGLVSALVFSLYINSDAVRKLYLQPEVLWLICPLFVYWICRMWMLSARGVMHEDPIIFALRDRATYFVVLICIVIMLAAKGGGIFPSFTPHH
jgi:4-hydroxybenzoate polyprenyltransferase/phosphoserine phosphatase